MSYPKIIKEAALERMFNTDLSLRYIADELGIPRATLHGWKRKYQMIKSDSETVNTPAESWMGRLSSTALALSQAGYVAVGITHSNDNFVNKDAAVCVLG